METTLIEKIKTHAEVIPGHLAVAFKNEQLNYHELYQKIINIGNVLHNIGIKKNDVVLFSAISKPEMIAVYLGIQFAGGIAAFIDKNATVETTFSIYKECNAVVLLTDRPFKKLDDGSGINIYSLRKLYNQIAVENDFQYVKPDSNDVAELIFSTGTTGTPKGIKLSYRSVLNILQNTIEGVGINHNDVLLLALPLNHSLALRNLRAYLWLGASIILQNGFTFVNDIEKSIIKYNCTGIVLVPATAAQIRNQLADKFSIVLGQFRYIEVGAGSLTIAQRKELPLLLPGVIIINTWGCSECGGAIFLNVNVVYKDEKKVMALGKPLPHITITTINDEGTPVIATKEQPGRLALKGDMCMVGYWNQPQLTQSTLIDNCLLTNDLVYIDGEYIYMLGRADDIINVGGEKVSPLEIENAVSQYKEVDDCVSIGVNDPDEILGQIPVLFYTQSSASFSVEELESFLVAHLERYKIPKKYVQIEEVPRNRMKKIDRNAVRKIWENYSSKG